MHSIPKFRVCHTVVRSEELLAAGMICDLLTVITTRKPRMTLLHAERPTRSLRVAACGWLI